MTLCIDLFEKKIHNIPFTKFDDTFPTEYCHDSNRVKIYIKNEYRKRFYNGVTPKNSPRKIHFHVTVAAKDANQVQTVLHLIQFEKVRKMMQNTLL